MARPNRDEIGRIARWKGAQGARLSRQALVWIAIMILLAVVAVAVTWML